MFGSMLKGALGAAGGAIGGAMGGKAKASGGGGAFKGIGDRMASKAAQPARPSFGKRIASRSMSGGRR